jgi:hypothetical protein
MKIPRRGSVPTKGTKPTRVSVGSLLPELAVPPATSSLGPLVTGGKNRITVALRWVVASGRSRPSCCSLLAPAPCPSHSFLVLSLAPACAHFGHLNSSVPDSRAAFKVCVFSRIPEMEYMPRGRDAPSPSTCMTRASTRACSTYARASSILEHGSSGPLEHRFDPIYTLTGLRRLRVRLCLCAQPRRRGWCRPCRWMAWTRS